MDTSVNNSPWCTLTPTMSNGSGRLTPRVKWGSWLGNPEVTPRVKWGSWLGNLQSTPKSGPSELSLPDSSKERDSADFDHEDDDVAMLSSMRTGGGILTTEEADEAIAAGRMMTSIASEGMCGPCRAKVLRLVYSIKVQLPLLLLLALDLALTIYQIVMDISEPHNAQPGWLSGITVAIVSILTVEVLLRLIGLGPRRFASQWANLLDLVISLLSLVLEIILVLAHSNSTAAGELALVRAVRPVARVSRVFRVTTKAYQHQKNMKAAARLLVGGNKRRYNKDGFDLDLVYVTDTLIGMSVPATGHMAAYRNPVDEVARFFKVRGGLVGERSGVAGRGCAAGELML